MQLPAAYNPFEWPEYLPHLLYPSRFTPEPVGTALPGARWGLWPFYFEEYRSDREPAAAPDGPNRLLVWQRPTRTDRPAGWVRLPLGSPAYIGYFDALDSNYLTRWSPRAARYARHWRREVDKVRYTIVPVSYESFAAAYAHSTVAQEIPTYELRRLRARIDAGARTSLWAVQRLSDNRIMAGLSAFETAGVPAGHYSCGFYLPEAAHEHLMVALMDHWFADSVTRGLAVLHLGMFAPPRSGATKRGKHISDFKAQFVTNYLLYQPPLFKFVRGTLYRQ